MEKTIFDIGHGIDVESFHCTNCYFNVTDDKVLNKALSKLREKMSKQVKVISIGEGLGIRIPNEIAKNYQLVKGKSLILSPEEDGFKIVV